MQALVPAAYALQQWVQQDARYDYGHEAMELFNAWVEWDQDRALDDCLTRFNRASVGRQASLAAMLAAVLFQSCRADKAHDLARAEKILTVVGRPEYHYILESYLEVYCVQRLTPRGIIY